ncbi:MAG: NIP7 N-terminal domain-related protein [Promethearchaeota archaeon]
MITSRRSTEEEIKLIKNYIDKLFGKNVAEKIIQNKNVIVAKGQWAEIFLVSHELFEVFERIHDKKKPYFLGLFLGELRNKRFKLSLEAVFEIANFTSHKIQLTMKGAQKLLYGRDISFSAIDKTWYDARKGDYAILLDENGFPIGLGKILHDFATMQKKSSKICIKNIIDRGWYLRKGQ